MSQVVRTSVSCPRCNHSFSAIIEQIIDVGHDPQAKARFLSGQVNMVGCPNCNHMLGVGTPLLYHDPTKDLLLIYVPMELTISTEEREGIIGDLTRRVTDNTPLEQRRAYLLQPKPALTLPGMIDIILEADGITAEMREAQQAKMQAIGIFLQVPLEQWPDLLQEQAEHIDHEFLQMLLATAQNANESGHPQMAEIVMALYNFMVENTEVGQEIREISAIQEQAVRDVSEDLQELGEQMTREDFMDLVLSYAGSEERIQAVVGLMRPALDYAFFEELTAMIEASSGEEQEDLVQLREYLGELTSIIDQQTQAVLQRAADTLRVILNSEDIDAAIQPRLDAIDDTFLAVLQANIQTAEQQNDTRTAERLQLVLEKVMVILRENAPPQIRFINQLMTLESEDDAYDLIEAHAPDFGPELLDLMEAIANDLNQNGQADVAQKILAFQNYAAEYVGEAPQ